MLERKSLCPGRYTFTSKWRFFTSWIRGWPGFEPGTPAWWWKFCQNSPISHQTVRFSTNSKTCQMAVFKFSKAMIWQDFLPSNSCLYENLIWTFWRNFHHCAMLEDDLDEACSEASEDEVKLEPKPEDVALSLAGLK